jgi:DNA repair photolyase
VFSFGMFKVKEIKAKSIITKSNLDVDYVINPYVGCQHACVYCYARFMKRFTNHLEPWGEFVDVKINAPELIPQNTYKYKGKSIMLSSVTDPYLPLERHYKLTRQILEKLIPLEPELFVLTKSDLILRDIELLKQFKHCGAGFSISTLDDNLRAEIEPAASPIQDRILALKVLKNAGIRNFVFLSPMLPYLTDYKKIIQELKPIVDFFMFENLNLRGSMAGPVFEWLAKKHPELLRKFMEAYKPGNTYWDEIEKDLQNIGKKQKLDFRIYFHHGQ